jgi:diguanylate cyclase (GGDEF)-like protein
MANDDFIPPDTTRLINQEKFGSIPQVDTQPKASLIVLSGWEIGREIELHGAEHILGRSPWANTYVNASSVSRRHARIVRCMEGNEVYFEIADLASRNGTRVNNVPSERARLTNGDKVQLGDVLFKFVQEDPVDSLFYQEVHRRIYYDQLTGLLTLEAFRRHLDMAVHESREDRPFTVAMTDLDGLKRVNDTYGHLAGRMVVREMGAMIRQVLRAQDRGGLYGGDETVILFPATPLDEARAIAERLRVTVEERVFDYDGNTFKVTISQGLAEWPRDGRAAEEMIAAADRALYAAKATGRNCVKAAGE